MPLYLIPENHDGSNHLHNPYEMRGARPILRRFRDDVIEMLRDMEKQEGIFAPGAKTFLAQSPLRSKPWVAAAMKTVGLVDEVETRSGACAIVLTTKGRSSIADLERYL